jgi:hypothetical protein
VRGFGRAFNPLGSAFGGMNSGSTNFARLSARSAAAGRSARVIAACNARGDCGMLNAAPTVAAPLRRRNTRLDTGKADPFSWMRSAAAHGNAIRHAQIAHA